METFSALLAICAGNSPVPGEFPTQRPVTRSFDVFFDLHPNKRLSKQWWGWWFETPSCSLWRHRNAMSGRGLMSPTVFPLISVEMIGPNNIIAALNYRYDMVKTIHFAVCYFIILSYTWHHWPRKWKVGKLFFRVYNLTTTLAWCVCWTVINPITHWIQWCGAMPVNRWVWQPRNKCPE